MRIAHAIVDVAYGSNGSGLGMCGKDAQRSVWCRLLLTSSLLESRAHVAHASIVFIYISMLIRMHIENTNNGNQRTGCCSTTPSNATRRSAEPLCNRKCQRSQCGCHRSPCIRSCGSEYVCVWCVCVCLCVFRLESVILGWHITHEYAYTRTELTSICRQRLHDAYTPYRRRTNHQTINVRR